MERANPKRSVGPDVGCPFSLVTFLLGTQQESNSPRRRNQEVESKQLLRILAKPRQQPEIQQITYPQQMSFYHVGPLP